MADNIDIEITESNEVIEVNVELPTSTFDLSKYFEFQGF